MSVQNRNKLNQLSHILPEGLLVDASWLEKKGYYRSLRSQYVASGWLERPVRGVFRRPRGVIRWEQVVISLQTLLGFPVSLGGRTALELQGYAHYLSQSQKSIHLYSDKKLPSWVFKLDLKEEFVYHSRLRLFPEIEISSDTLSIVGSQYIEEGVQLDGGLRIHRWGQWDWPLLMSSPERAILELMDELPNKETFHMADVMMEGLVNLSPRRLQVLLESTSNIKVKRLFFFFADRHNNRWFKKIKRDKINLGKGKRMLVKGGKLDPTYQITVPEKLIKDEINGF
ncbi:MAG: type IV toxin-antitoxin system AbiEi family antitoxin domain-containing protein [Pseudomonadales bacterium]